MSTYYYGCILFLRVCSNGEENQNHSLLLSDVANYGKCIWRRVVRLDTRRGLEFHEEL